MESYRTEEEQVEALKRWWDENGRSTVAVVVLALGASFGWRFWQDYNQQQAEIASARYDEMVATVQSVESEEDAAALRASAEALKADFPDSTYAQFAALHLARLDVVGGELGEAELELRWVLMQNPPVEIRQLAELRLARVIAAQGDTEGALAIVSAAEAGSYAPAYAEAEGDFQADLGNRDAAIAAYERALAESAASRSGASQALRLKLNALSPVPPREFTAEEE